MAMNWFSGVKTMDGLRQSYKELLKQYHPDNGGDLHIMQEINAAYDAVFAVLSHQNETGKESLDEEETEADKALRAVLNHITGYDIEIEIIGSWIWCFNCYAYKDSLKTLGFKYAPKKRAWTWHYGEYACHHKGEIPIDDIRHKYGSQRVHRSHNTQYHLS